MAPFSLNGGCLSSGNAYATTLQERATGFRRLAMTRPDFQRAKEYALSRLAHELPSHLCYHSLSHTRDDVLPAAERLAGLTGGLDREDEILLLTAALFHDIGFIRHSIGHEEAGQELAREALPEFGYTPRQIEAIGGMIMATKLPQSPGTLLEEILVDADLDVLGRDDFLSRNDDLRNEVEASFGRVCDGRWYREQVSFLEQHRYFTEAARSLRDAKKRENLVALRRRLAASSASGDP